MFVGRARVPIDDKNRVTLPSKYRPFLKSEDCKGLFIALWGGKDAPAMYLYPQSFFGQVVERIRGYAAQQSSPADVLSSFAAHSEFVNIDAQFRMVLPRELVEASGLSREAEMIGAMWWIELWRPEEWQRRQEQVRPSYANLRNYLLGFDKPQGTQS